MAGIGQLNVTIGANIKNFEQSLKGIERNINRFQRQLTTIGTNLTQAVSLPLAALGGSAVKAFGEFEALEKAFAAVADESVNVTAEIERLRKVAEAPGLGFNEAVKASTRLQAVGLEAGEAARVIEQYGNAVARSGGGRAEFDGAILALTQIASKGKISAEEINQLNERIFEIRPALTAAFGTADSEQLQKLGISAQEFIARTTEEFAKLERVQGGLANSFENFGDSVRTSLTTLGREISTAINLPGILDKISASISRVTTFFQNLSPEAKRTAVNIGLIAIAIGPVLIGVAKLASVFQLAITGAKLLIGGVRSLAVGFALLSSPIAIAVAGFVALIGGVAFLYDRFEGVRRIINGVADSISALGKLARDVAGNIAEGFKDLFSGNFRDAASSFKEAFSKSSIKSIGTAAADGFREGFQDGSNRIETAIDNIKNKLKSLSTPAQGGQGGSGTQAFDLSGFDAATQGGAAKIKIDTTDVDRATQKVQDLVTLTQRGIFSPEPITLTTQETNNLNIALQNSSLALSAQRENAISAAEALGQAKLAADNFVPTLASFQGPSEVLRVLGDAANAAGQAFALAAEQGEVSFKRLGAAALAAARQVIGAYIKEGVTGLVKNILSGPTGKALGPLALGVAAVAGGAAAALFSGLINKIAPPKLAQGGLAYAPTLATVGDNPNARIDPEVIAPLSKLKAILGEGGGGYIAEARISGDDLLILVDKAERRLNRIR
jgi:tape measure domain-containing protein